MKRRALKSSAIVATSTTKRVYATGPSVIDAVANETTTTTLLPRRPLRTTRSTVLATVTTNEVDSYSGKKQVLSHLSHEKRKANESRVKVDETTTTTTAAKRKLIPFSQSNKDHVAKSRNGKRKQCDRDSSDSKKLKKEKTCVGTKDDHDEGSELKERTRSIGEDSVGNDPLYQASDTSIYSSESDDQYDNADLPLQKKRRRKKSSDGDNNDNSQWECQHCHKRFTSAPGLQYHLDQYVCRPTLRPGGPIIRGRRKKRPNDELEVNASAKVYQRIRGSIHDRTCPQCHRVFTSVAGMQYHSGMSILFVLENQQLAMQFLIQLSNLLIISSFLSYNERQACLRSSTKNV
jgi:hypothetical protein